MEREVGGGIRMGNTCKPMAVSFQCMTKSTTIKKKKSYVFQSICHHNSSRLEQQKSKLGGFFFFFFAFREISRFF